MKSLVYQDKEPQYYPLGNEEPLKDFKQRSGKVRFAIEITYSGNPGGNLLEGRCSDR